MNNKTVWMTGMNILDGIPKRKQRQDSVSDQLADLCIIANRLGLYDAADAIRQWCDNLPVLKYGCHCDLEPGEKAQDDCVIDHSVLSDCIYAKPGMRPEQCEYWKPIFD